MNHQPILPQQEAWHFQDYVNVIIRRRKTFAITFLAVAVSVTLFTFLVPPLYESVATVFVKDDKGKVGQMGDLLLNGPGVVESEIEMLKSRSNAEKVVSKLHLDWKVDKVSNGTKFKILEFSSSSKDPIYHVELTGGGRYVVRDDDGIVVGTGQSGVLLRGKGLLLLLTDVTGTKGESFQLRILPFKKTVESLRKKIKIAEVAKKTNVISITYRNRNPEVARDVVNTLVQAYLDKGVALKSEEASRTVAFVTDQLKGVKTDLEDAEKNLAAYKKSAGFIQLDAAAQTLVDSLSDVEKQKAEVSLHKKQVEFALASLKTARGKGGIYSPAIASDDPVLAAMASKLSDLEVQKKGLLAESTENHPGVKIVQNQIDELQKKIQATYETSLRNDVKKEQSIANEIARRDAQLKKLPAAEQDLARLMRLTKVNSDIYTFLLQKHEEARIAEASTINNISIVDPAIAEDEPASPKVRVNLVLGALIGLMLGGGLCFFREYVDDTVKDPEEAKRNLSLPLLALIPYISRKDGELALISHLAPKSVASEAFKELRTSLRFCALKKQKQVLLITSSLAGEGKSTIACNLAITLAQTGARVLLVDCDLRCSSLHDKLGLDWGVGLTELLAGDIQPEAAFTSTRVAGLDLVKAGAVPPNPAEMLGSESMARFIEEMRKAYDFIVIDSPPVLPVTDAPVLTAISDLVLVVVESGKVPTKAVKRAKEMLLAVAAPLAGFVFSDKKAFAGPYGYGYGYGIGYGQGFVRDTKRPWWRFWG